MKYRNSDFSKDRYFMGFRDLLAKAYRSGYKVWINTARRLNNCTWARRLKGNVSIQDIFINEYENFLKIYGEDSVRKSVKENIERMIKCRNFDYGFAYYECPNCNNFYMQGFTCKSRFCPTCGKQYRDRIGTNVASKLLKVKHRQLVFTIPFELRIYFRKYRDLLSILFKAVNLTLTETLKDKAKRAYKREGRKLGFISFLHTYGRDLKWHPHIHVLYAERFMNSDGSLHNFYFLSFEAIRKRFLYTVLNLMNAELKKKSKEDYEAFKKDRSIVLNRCKNGSYFYGKSNTENDYSITSAKSTAKYIARYASHPAISERRIVSYDKENKMVTWFYDPHEDDTRDEENKIGRQTITESVYDFMKRLMIHIPEKHFVQIRYYGFYSNKFKLKDTKNDKLFSKKDIDDMQSKLKWTNGLMHSYGYNPLLCECGHLMIFNYESSYFPKTTRGNTT